jgi:hypothetical protein
MKLYGCSALSQKLIYCCPRKSRRTRRRGPARSRVVNPNYLRTRLVVAKQADGAGRNFIHNVAISITSLGDSEHAD